MVNFRFPQGMLSQGGQIPMSMGQPILAQQQAPSAQLSKYTSNARQSRGMNFPMIPDNRINMGTEGLMRIGGAMMGGARDGALSAYSAGMDTYGNIMDYNRQADMERMQIEEARKLEEQRRQDLMRKMNSTGAGKEGDKPDPEAIAMADFQIETMETILEGLREGGLTGFFDGTAMKWADRLGWTDWWTGTDEGSKRAYLRQLLQEFKVDQTLTKTALTKGAISNQEMTLFMSPFPDIALDNEGSWIPQIQKRLEIAKKIRAAAGGAPYTPTTAPTTTTGPTVDQSVIDEANAVINGG